MYSFNIFIAPKPKAPDVKRKPSSIPIEEKKNFVWIEHHRDLVELSKEIPKTKLINVCDREADFFEMFDEQRKNLAVDMLIRAHHNRNIKKDPFKLFEAVRQTSKLSKISANYVNDPFRERNSGTSCRNTIFRY